jgi:hypothetical protein
MLSLMRDTIADEKISANSYTVMAKLLFLDCYLDTPDIFARTSNTAAKS